MEKIFLSLFFPHSIDKSSCFLCTFVIFPLYLFLFSFPLLINQKHTNLLVLFVWTNFLISYTQVRERAWVSDDDSVSNATRYQRLFMANIIIINSTTIKIKNNCLHFNLRLPLSSLFHTFWPGQHTYRIRQ